MDSEEQHSRQGEQRMKRHGQMPHITEKCVTGTKDTCKVLLAGESGKRGQEEDHEGLVHQITSVHIYPAGAREPATTSQQERGGFMLTIGRSLGEGSLRAQRSQRKGSSAGAGGGGTEAFKQGNQSSSSDQRSQLCGVQDGFEAGGLFRTV